MKRAAAVLALALLVLGCGPPESPVEPVSIITGPPHDYVGCFTYSATGELVADPTYGTVFIPDGQKKAVPIAWRPGFTAVHDGSQVGVFDPYGQLIAVTGRRYLIPGGGVGAGGTSGLVWPELKTDVFWACGTPEPL